MNPYFKDYPIKNLSVLIDNAKDFLDSEDITGDIKSKIRSIPNETIVFIFEQLKNFPNKEYIHLKKMFYPIDLDINGLEIQEYKSEIEKILNWDEKNVYIFLFTIVEYFINALFSNFYEHYLPLQSLLYGDKKRSKYIKKNLNRILLNFEKPVIKKEKKLSVFTKRYKLELSIHELEKIHRIITFIGHQYWEQEGLLTPAQLLAEYESNPIRKYKVSSIFLEKLINTIILIDGSVVSSISYVNQIEMWDEDIYRLYGIDILDYERFEKLGLEQITQYFFAEIISKIENQTGIKFQYGLTKHIVNIEVTNEELEALFDFLRMIARNLNQGCYVSLRSYQLHRITKNKLILKLNPDNFFWLKRYLKRLVTNAEVQLKNEYYLSYPRNGIPKFVVLGTKETYQYFDSFYKKFIQIKLPGETRKKVVPNSDTINNS